MDLEILLFEQIESTHLFLEDALKTNKLKAPVLIGTNRQTNGIGSRGNRWESLEGNLFISFAMDKDDLPPDLPIGSASIYFAFLMKQTLKSFGSKVWVKWPNDLYLERKKLGGVITKMTVDDTLICSIGINLKYAPKNFHILDIDIDKLKLIEAYLLKLKEEIFWKNIFSQYCVEFEKSREFSFYDKALGKRIYLNDASLNEDGSVTIDNRKVYSLR